jgi:catechol 2,3-dioxygenase-like lactoylglutathione lyase family enzyme
MKPLALSATLLLLFYHSTMGYSQKVTDVSAVSITVGDLDREVDFFVQILDFKKIKVETKKGAAVAKLFGLDEKTATVRIATLQLGQEQIQLMDFDGTKEGRPVPADTRSNDLWFQHLAIVVADMDSAYQKLLRNQVQHVSTFPETLPDYLPNAAGIRAFYFRDPEGHNLELIWFPPGKGNAKWQTQNKDGQAGVFLGIDHTAIAISNTKQSMAFYRDALGLDYGGHSENYGPEQEHLNQVFGARLDINGLHAATGFGVEFLRYIAPPGGRTIPTDSRTTDLWHYHTELWADDLPAVLQKMEKQGYSKGSATVVSLDSVDCIMLRDPDGHALLLKGAKRSSKN